MKNRITCLGMLLLLSALAGCAYEPAPYFGGVPPYYGTTAVPAYAYADVSLGGYYPYSRAQHIYSHYNNNYWHHQQGQLRRGGAPAMSHAPAGGHMQSGGSGGRR